ncbi:hypothetical protein [Nocardiopsis coralliicola]
MTLPGADEMFFRSSEPIAPEPAPESVPPPARPEEAPASEGNPAGGGGRPEPVAESDRPVARRSGRGGGKRGGKRKQPAAPQPSGRERHDEKITVYVSAAELLALEQARLTLRAEHGLSADRGRIVREAVGVLLADFDEHGEESMLVRRLDS